MQDVANLASINFSNSLGYALVTRAVVKNIATYAQEGEDTLSSCCTMSSLLADSGTRKPFREAFFSLGGLHAVVTPMKFTECVFWTGVTGVRFLFCLEITSSWDRAKDSFLTVISNFACSIIAFVGMCRPKLGIHLWYFATKTIFECAGDEIITNIAQGIVGSFDQLYNAMAFNLGKKETAGMDQACDSMREKAKKIGRAVEDLKVSENVQDAETIEFRVVTLISEMLSSAK